MRPVRPSGTPTTDSSSAPGEQPPPSFEGGVPAGDGLYRTHRGADSSQPNDSGAAAKRHPRHRSTYPDGDRSIRPRVDASHLSVIPRLATRTPGAPVPTVFLVTDGWFRVPRRVFLPEGSRDPWALVHFCHHDCNASTKSQTLSPHDLRWTFGLATENRLVCGRLRMITRERPPVAGGAPLRCFPIPLHPCALRMSVDCRLETRVTQHLSSSLMAPVGCGDTLRTASSPCSTEELLIRAIPRRTTRTASPRCPPSSRRA
jgi:hypothetical protein